MSSLSIMIMHHRKIHCYLLLTYLDMAKKVISPPPELRDAITTPTSLRGMLSNQATIWKLARASITARPTLILYGMACMKNGAIAFKTSVGRISASKTIELCPCIKSSIM